jgi:hypothetical protein
VCIIGAAVSLSPGFPSSEQMEEFGSWLFLDLAIRPSKRGRRQTQPLAGVFVGWTFGKNPRVRHQGLLRGTDFSFRLALWIHGWYRAGMSIKGACDKARKQDFVRSWLGKGQRGRRCRWAEGGTEVDETAKTVYYKFRARRPQMDQLLMGWFLSFCAWREWVVNADEETLRFVKGLYESRGQRDNGRRFLELALRLRQPTASPERGLVG